MRLGIKASFFKISLVVVLEFLDVLLVAFFAEEYDLVEECQLGHNLAHWVKV